MPSRTPPKNPNGFFSNIPIGPTSRKPGSLLDDAERLNQSLYAIEKRLSESPPCIEWMTFVNSKAIKTISFNRLRDKWQYVIEVPASVDGHDTQLRTLSELSLLQKAEMAKVLPVFITEYLNEQKRRHSLIAEANEALEQVSKLMGGA